MGVAGPIFELHPSNLVRINIILSCKDAEIFPNGLDLTKSVWECSVHILRCPWLSLALEGLIKDNSKTIIDVSTHDKFIFK